MIQRKFKQSLQKKKLQIFGVQIALKITFRNTFACLKPHPRHRMSPCLQQAPPKSLVLFCHPDTLTVFFSGMTNIPSIKYKSGRDSALQPSRFCNGVLPLARAIVVIWFLIHATVTIACAKIFLQSPFCFSTQLFMSKNLRLTCSTVSFRCGVQKTQYRRLNATRFLKIRKWGVDGFPISTGMPEHQLLTSFKLYKKTDGAGEHWVSLFSPRSATSLFTCRRRIWF